MSARSSASPPGSSSARTPVAPSSSSSTSPSGRSAYTFTLSDEGVSVEERPADGAETRIRGTTEDWVKAFSPERDRSGLERSGDHALADAVLDGLAAVGRRASAGAQEAA